MSLLIIEESLMNSYLSDISVVQTFAELNRLAIIDELVRGMKWKIDDPYSCVHNYLDFRAEKPILRKGAVSAQKNERIIIPNQYARRNNSRTWQRKRRVEFFCPSWLRSHYEARGCKKIFYAECFQIRDERNLFFVHLKGNFGRIPVRVPRPRRNPKSHRTDRGNH